MKRVSEVIVVGSVVGSLLCLLFAIARQQKIISDMKSELASSAVVLYAAQEHLRALEHPQYSMEDMCHETPGYVVTLDFRDTGPKMSRHVGVKWLIPGVNCLEICGKNGCTCTPYKEKP